MENFEYIRLGKQIRKQIVEMVASAGRGHIASAFSIVEILNVLYENVLKVDPHNPHWPKRDRLILSKGHGCLALYPILANKGFFSADHLKEFCSFDGILGGHPEHLKVPGIEASTGSLGHGLSLGIGMAISSRLNQNNYKVYVLLGDGECGEGSIWESALSASKHKLSNLIVLVDYNKYQSYAKVSEVTGLEPFGLKWTAFGFRVFEADMDHPQTLEKILLDDIPKIENQPSVIICHTIKGKGVSFCENDPSWHHKSQLTEKEIKDLISCLQE